MTTVVVNLDNGEITICAEGRQFRPATLDRERLELAIRILKRTLDDPWRGFDPDDLDLQEEKK